MVTEHIRSIGIELEGGWCCEYPEECASDDPSCLCGWKEDSSVSVSGDHVGEIASDIFTDLPCALEWVDTTYPDNVNGTCGLHVHFGLDDTAPAFDPTFWPYIRNGLRQWSTAKYGRVSQALAKRLDGQNSYCAATVGLNAPNRQYSGDLSCGRYHAVNLRSLHSHKTVEVRVLPMFRSKTVALSAVETLINLVDTFWTDPPEQTLTATLRYVNDYADPETAYWTSSELLAECIRADGLWEGI